MTDKPPPVANVFPPEFRDALVASQGNLRALDGITDKLVQRGFCRPRSQYMIPVRADLLRRLQALA